MSETIEKMDSKKDFKKTPGGWYRYWLREMNAADKRVRRWHKQGHKIQARYQDRRGLDDRDYTGDDQNAYRVNLFHANVKTLRDMVYGNPPRVEVSRRYADPEDDTARVAGTILQRLLNNSVETSGDDTKSTLGYCLEDRLLPGFGIARVRYEYDTETEDVPALMDTEDPEKELAPGFQDEFIINESAPLEYVHWDDFRWGWARTWSEVPWIAFRSYQKKDDVEKRFGEKIARDLQYKNKSIHSVEDRRFSSDEIADAWDRAEIWEIWEKSSRCVYWWSRGFEKILDKIYDPLELFGFWPCPEPMMANVTTSLLLPQPDFAIAQDLYNEIDALETRIGVITTAVRVVGVYDKSAEGVKRMLQEGCDNELIPVENWAAFAEGKGLDGKVQWMPIKDIVEALDKLVQMRTDAMTLLYEVTGMSEILRGANGPDRETAEAASGKKQFASVRVQGIQEDFARFASDLMALRAEVIGKHFSPEIIQKNSNIDLTYDREHAPAAIALIKQWEDAMWRVKIEPESLAMIDYASLKKDRSEFVAGLAQFLGAAMPLAEMDPNTVPPMLQMLKWTMAGFKGSNEIEGVLDKAIDRMLKAGPQKKQEQSPEAIKAQAQREKAEQDRQLQQMKHEHNLQEIRAKTDAALQELRAEMQKELRVIMEEMRAAIMEETAQSQAAMAQDDHETENQIKVDNNKAAKAPKGNGDARA